MKLESFTNLFLTEQEKTRQEKQKEWNKLEHQIEEYGGFDEKIKLLVIALWANKFPTYESCEGHFDPNQCQYNCPTIHIGYYPDRIDDLQLYSDYDHVVSEKEREERLPQIIKENEILKIHIEFLLDEFNKKRKSEQKYKLNIKETHYNTFALSTESIVNKADPYIALQDQQKLMSEFGIFLKEKYFDSK
ncbi:MAG: hypothetical protein WCS86_00880 [Candidatus Paceibacterota bacterium]